MPHSYTIRPQGAISFFQNTVTGYVIIMKRSDTFILGMSAFLAANCVSYFMLSEAPYVIGWDVRLGDYDIYKSIGFPFVMFSIIQTQMYASSLNCLGNLIVAIIVSYFFAKHVTNRLPPLWKGSDRALHFNLYGFLIIAIVLSIILGISMIGPGLGLTIRNIICLGGSPLIYVWLIYRRRIGWTRLASATVGLTILVFLIDCRYARLINIILLSWNDFSTSAKLYIFGLTIIRIIVPVFGLMSLAVIIHIGYSITRQNGRKWLKMLKLRLSRCFPLKWG